MNKIVLFLTLVSMISCSPEKVCHVHGIISSSYDGNYVMLFQFRRDTIPELKSGQRTRQTSDTIFSVDTTVIHNGRFEFRAKEDLEDLAVITTGNWPDSVFSVELALEKGDVEVNLNDMTFRGTPLNDAYIDFQQKIAEAVDKESVNEIVRNYLNDNIQNPYGRSLLYQYEKYSNDYESFQIYVSLLDEKYRRLPEIQDVLKTIAKSQTLAERRHRIIGKPFVDYELMSYDGVSAHISDFIGQSDYLLIDFWASWCHPCIESIPHIRSIYEKTSRDAFDVLSISLDDNDRMWRQAINKYNIGWNNLCAMDNSKEVQDGYSIYSIPYSLIVDRQGICVYEGLNDEMLDTELELP